GRGKPGLADRDREQAPLRPHAAGGPGGADRVPAAPAVAFGRGVRGHAAGARAPPARQDRAVAQPSALCAHRAWRGLPLPPHRLRVPRLRFGLLGRVALALAAVGLLPLALASLQLLRINQEALVEQVLRTHTVAATTAAERVAAFLATRESLARGAAASPELATPRSPSAQQLLAGSLQSWA